MPLRRIEQANPVKDGIVCIDNVCTKTGVFMRPVVKIYPLEKCFVDDAHQGGRNVT